MEEGGQALAFFSALAAAAGRGALLVNAAFFPRGPSLPRSLPWSEGRGSERPEGKEKSRRRVRARIGKGGGHALSLLGRMQCTTPHASVYTSSKGPCCCECVEGRIKLVRPNYVPALNPPCS